jgi:hypothetical protein
MSGQELADYIVEHADTIAVRVQIDGRAQSRYLSELPVGLAMMEAIRLYERGEIPYRALNRIERDLQADVFSREPNGLIALRMTQEEFLRLLLVLGYATDAANNKQDDQMFAMSIRLTNRLNAGNPDFIPYEIPEPANEEALS